MCQSRRGKKRFCFWKRAGGAEPAATLPTFSKKLMPLVHWVAVMVVGHCVGVMTFVLEVAPEGVVEMVLVLE